MILVPEISGVLPILRDTALIACFWAGYATGLIRGVTPILLQRVL
jgi:hypothetical protein